MSHVKPFMTPKMYPSVPISDAGRTVTVKGPINWDSGSDPQEVAAVFTLVVSQMQPQRRRRECDRLGDEDLHERAGLDSEGEGRWSAEAELVPGGATVAAWATIAHSDGGYASYEWTLPVLLQQQP